MAKEIHELREYYRRGPEDNENKTIHNGNYLLQRDIPPLDYIVDDLLPRGSVYILAGAEKMGKSWLALQLSISVSKGESFINQETKQTNTLYLDLEGGERRLKERLEKTNYGNGLDLDGWHYIFDMPCLGEGLEEQLSEAIVKHDIGLVIIDVLALIRSKAIRQISEYTHDYNDIKALQNIARQHNVLIVLLHHTTKMINPDDDFKNMRGAGLFAAADAGILFGRKRDENRVILKVTGRDVTQQEIVIEFIDSSCTYEFVGGREEVILAEDPLIIGLKKFILKQDSTWWQGSAESLFAHMSSFLKGESLPINSIQFFRKLNEYNDKGLLKKAGIIYDSRRKRTGSEVTIYMI